MKSVMRVSTHAHEDVYFDDVFRNNLNNPYSCLSTTGLQFHFDNFIPKS